MQLFQLGSSACTIMIQSRLIGPLDVSLAKFVLCQFMFSDIFTGLKILDLISKRYIFCLLACIKLIAPVRSFCAGLLQNRRSLSFLDTTRSPSCMPSSNLTFQSIIIFIFACSCDIYKNIMLKMVVNKNCATLIIRLSKIPSAVNSCS